MRAIDQAAAQGETRLTPHWRQAPWWLKAGLQTALSLLPFGEVLNYRLQIWNGFNSNFAWAVNANIEHLCNLIRITTPFGLHFQGANILEVGTGWTPTLPIGLSLLGAKVHTYDHVRHVRTANVVRLLDLLPRHLSAVAEVAHSDAAVLEAKLNEMKAEQGESPDGWLTAGEIHYHASADASMSGLPDESLDLYFSSAVFEHVPLPAVKAMLREAYRTLRPGGLTYHVIGLFDHYTTMDASITRVNFLKYSDFAWRIIGQNRIQFHNRLRASEFVLLFREAGFEIVSVLSEVDERSLKALETMRLNPRFDSFDKRDLATFWAIITARKPIAPQA